MEVMGKEEAGRRVKEGCVAWWSLERKGEERVVKYVHSFSWGAGGVVGELLTHWVVVRRKGSPPVIKVAIKNVGKRQVTLVSGAPYYAL